MALGYYSSASFHARLFGVLASSFVVWRIYKFLTGPVAQAVNYSLTDLTYAQAKLRTCAGLKEVLARGVARSDGRPFYAILCSGLTLVLPHTAAPWIGKNAESFSAEKSINREFFTDQYSDLAPFRQPNEHKQLFAHRIKQRPEDLIDDATSGLSDTLTRLWGEHPTWRQRSMGIDIPYIMSTVTARLFVGEELCYNEGWLQIMPTITRALIVATVQLQLVPKYFRFVAWRILPSCRRLRRLIHRSYELLRPVVERREHAGAKDPPHQTDVIDWLNQVKSGDTLARMWPHLQLCIASTAMGDFILQVFNNLCTHPATIVLLREEALKVVQEHNGSLPIAALEKLHHMDSFFKETMRMKPTSPVIMSRTAIHDVTFPDGTQIPRGTHVCCSQLNLWDDRNFPNAKVFEPDRFLNQTQFTTSSYDNLVWGHGPSACAGRFFASYAMKTTLVHILLKYDFELAADSVLPTPWGVSAADVLMAEEHTTMNIKRRQNNSNFSL